ncbi:MAG: ABC transporter ATP-binding protein [Deltaproteobacteria bacterium]|nr:ABC transporter ATP-binding protein [Deltaproteobacteria bacterium]
MIRTTALTRQFGAHRALKGIDLHVEEGDLFGFIGPNGAGKTTTIRILTTLLEPSSGDATVGGHSVWRDKAQIRRLIGYLPDSFGVYRDMTVTEYLHFFAAAYGIPHRDRAGLVGGLLELVDLEGKSDALIDTLSRGMQQRLGLARTLVHDPKVLILDEPASGLDPRARIEIREILKELQRMGKTILLSSHILSELAEVCTRLAILEQGEMVAQGTLEELIARAADRAPIRLHTPDDARAAVVLREHPAVETADQAEDEVVVRLRDEVDVADLSAHLAGRGLFLRRLEREQPTLEQVFMHLTKGGV